MPVSKEGGQQARYTFRLRVSPTARTQLLAEWDRCRWEWNECVAKAKAVHAHNKLHPEEKQTCGPAQLDRMLTEARRVAPWLREGASVPQQQIIRGLRHFPREGAQGHQGAPSRQSASWDARLEEEV